jgi:hypothetical protein
MSADDRVYSTRERLRGLAAFLPVFAAPDFSFGHWEGSVFESGRRALPTFTLSDEASAFVREAYRIGWVQGFDWQAWKESPEARRLRDDPDELARASPEQLSRLLTVSVRTGSSKVG